MYVFVAQIEWNMELRNGSLLSFFIYPLSLSSSSLSLSLFVDVYHIQKATDFTDLHKGVRVDQAPHTCSSSIFLTERTKMRVIQDG